MNFAEVSGQWIHSQYYNDIYRVVVKNDKGKYVAKVEFNYDYPNGEFFFDTIDSNITDLFEISKDEIKIMENKIVKLAQQYVKNKNIKFEKDIKNPFHIHQVQLIDLKVCDINIYDNNNRCIAIIRFNIDKSLQDIIFGKCKYTIHWKISNKEKYSMGINYKKMKKDIYQLGEKYIRENTSIKFNKKLVIGSFVMIIFVFFLKINYQLLITNY